MCTVFKGEEEVWERERERENIHSRHMDVFLNINICMPRYMDTFQVQEQEDTNIIFILYD